MPAYYARFTLSDGTALTGDGGQPWFTLSGFDAAFEAIPGVASSSGGTSANRLAFDPLRLGLAGSDPLASQLEGLEFRQLALHSFEVTDPVSPLQPGNLAGAPA